MNALVTGGAGFIGTNLVCALVERGDSVTVLDNLSASTRETLADVAHSCTFIRGDVRHLETVRRACEGAELVFHLAAIRPVSLSIDNPLLVHETNATGTLHVLLAARDAGIRRVVFASSSAVYGNAAHTPTTEKEPVRPESPYALAKYVGEEYCRLFSLLYGLETVSLRYFNVYGPYGKADALYPLVIPIFLERFLRGLPAELHGDGEQKRDFVHVSDVVHANLLAATSPRVGRGEIYNVGSGSSVSIKDIHDLLQELLGITVPPTVGPRRSGDVERTEADIRHARDVLEYQPRVALREGLLSVIEWHRTHAAVRSPHATHG